MFARIALSGLGGALAGLVANASAATMASLPGTPDAIFTVVGEALPGSDLLPFGSPATSIRLGSDDTQPQAVLALPDNAMLVALGTRILRVDRRGLVHRYAGTGSVGWGGDGGPALRARFGGIRDLARLADGSVLVVDDANSDVRAIDPHGRISTVVARGAHVDGGFRGDGRPAVAALLCFPTALSAEPQGRYLIADLCNHRVREVTPDGRIATVAGNGAKVHDGDGGPASAAGIGSPTAVAAMPDGGFVVASDNEDDVPGDIRHVDAAGQITTAAHFSADSLAALPDGSFVAARVDPQSDLATAIVRVAPDGTVTTLAGRGTSETSTGPPESPFDGDTDAALAASLWMSDVARDNDGGLLLTDWADGLGVGGRVRYLPPPRPARLAVGVARDTLPTGRHVSVHYVVTRAARVTIELRRGDRTIARISSTVAAGRHTATLSRTVPSGRYEVHVMAQGRTEPFRIVDDRITIFPGGILTVEAAKSVVTEDFELANRFGGGFDLPPRCQRMTLRRVDCAVTGDGLCQHIQAVVLHPDGTLTERSYGEGTSRCRFRARPHWDDAPEPTIP